MKKYKAHDLYFIKATKHDAGHWSISFLCKNPGCAFAIHLPIKPDSEANGICVNSNPIKQVMMLNQLKGESNV